MPATVKIYSYHGSTPSGSDVTDSTIRFKTADNDAQDTSNPIVIPDSGTNYSYIKQLALYAETSPSGTIDNVKFYGPGSLGWTGCGCYVTTSSTYTDPTTQQDTALSGWTDNFGSYTSSSPLSVAGSISNPDTGRVSDYVVLQLGVESTAEPGVQSSVQITMRYDET